MATVTGLTAARMLEIEGESIVDAEIVGTDLILVKHDGTQLNVGPVIGPTGPQGPQGLPGVAGVSSIPGEIKAWPGSSLPNQGSYGKWVWADGAVYSEATYPIAAAHIDPAWKTAYGQSSPGVGNFRVPDLRGLVLAGLDAMPGGSRANRMTRSIAITLAGKTGEETHVITIPEMPAHTHPSGNGESFGSRVTYGSSQASASVDGGADVHLGTTTVGSAGGSAAHENVQPTVFVPYIVRLDG